MFLIHIASSNIMILAELWYHTAIICAKENVLTQLKLEQVEILYVTTSSTTTI